MISTNIIYRRLGAFRLYFGQEYAMIFQIIYAKETLMASQ